LARLVNS